MRLAINNLRHTNFVTLEVILLVVVDSVLACAAAPGSLASTVRGLLSPLQFVNLGGTIRALTVVVAVTLEFVPALIRRTRGVVGTRGTENTSLRDKGLGRGVGTLVPVLVPLLFSTMEHTTRLTSTVRYEYCGSNRNGAHVGRLGLRFESCTLDFIAIYFNINIVLLGVFVWFWIEYHIGTDSSCGFVQQRQFSQLTMST